MKRKAIGVSLALGLVACGLPDIAEPSPVAEAQQEVSRCSGTAPAVQTKALLSGSMYRGGSLAVDRCTGNVGVAFAQVASQTTSYVHFAVYGPEGQSLGAPVRVSASVQKAEPPRVVWTGSSYLVVWAAHRGADGCVGSGPCPMDLLTAELSATGRVQSSERSFAQVDSVRLEDVQVDRAMSRTLVAWAGKSAAVWQGNLTLLSPAGSVISQTTVTPENPAWSGWRMRATQSAGRWLVAYVNWVTKPTAIHVESFSPSLIFLNSTSLPNPGVFPTAFATREGGTASLFTQANGASTPPRVIELNAFDLSSTVVMLDPASRALHSYDGSAGGYWDGQSYWSTAYVNSPSAYVLGLAHFSRGGLELSPARAILSGAAARNVTFEVVDGRAVMGWWTFSSSAPSTIRLAVLELNWSKP